jgi:hypothetical protein
MRITIRLVACAALVTVAAGCASSGTASDGATTTTAKAPAATTTSAPTTTTAATTTAAPTTAAPTTAAPTTAAPPTEPATNLMPDVVCMNLQEAQDFIQAETGVFYSRSEDATGADRSQILDSNWIVVAQRPAPGTPIDEGDAVLSAVKIGEPNDC